MPKFVQESPDPRKRTGECRFHTENDSRNAINVRVRAVLPKRPKKSESNTKQKGK